MRYKINTLFDRKKRILILLFILLIAALTAVPFLRSMGQNNSAPTFPDYASVAPTMETPFGRACDELLNEYVAMLSVSEMEWNANADAYTAEYPRVNRTYVGFYHLGLVNTLYAAVYDIDKNGMDEFFIGLGDRRDVMEVGVYAFNGSTLVPLSLTDTTDGYQIFTDGVFIQSDRSGEITAIKKIAPDGCTLEATETYGLAVGDIPEESDIAALGGHLSLTNWAKVSLESNSEPFT